MEDKGQESSKPELDIDSPVEISKIVGDQSS